MKKILILLSISCIISPSYGFDLSTISPVNPLENKQNSVNLTNPSYELKKATLTKNTLKNQYSIAMDKFIQSNVRSSYSDFKIIIDNITPNDYAYMRLSKEMASIGFFSLSELAMSKIKDKDISSLLEEDVKNFYFPSSELSHKDQIYLAEMYSNIMYNDQSREATEELLKQTSILVDSDYANYLVAFGSMKNGNIKQAKEFINKAISKNSKNINYKRLKAEILAQEKNAKDTSNSLNDLKTNKTVIFDKELHASQQYVLYKSAKNEYLKKYHLAYYYYDKGELNKALGVLQTSVSGKKNINKDVYSLSAKVYYDLKEFEKAQSYAQKSLDIDKTDLTASIVMGDIYYRNKDYVNAQKYYKKVLGKDELFYTEIALANTYQKLNDLNQSLKIYFL